MALGSYKLKTNKFNSFKEPLDRIFINIPGYRSLQEKLQGKLYIRVICEAMQKFLPQMEGFFTFTKSVLISWILFNSQFYF